MVGFCWHFFARGSNDSCEVPQLFGGKVCNSEAFNGTQSASLSWIQDKRKLSSVIPVRLSECSTASHERRSEVRSFHLGPVISKHRSSTDDTSCPFISGAPTGLPCMRAARSFSAMADVANRYAWPKCTCHGNLAICLSKITFRGYDLYEDQISSHVYDHSFRVTAQLRLKSHSKVIVYWYAQSIGPV